MELSTEKENQVQEQLFCTQFELQSLSTLLVKSEAERWVPGFIWPLVDKEHRARYEFATRYVANKNVLDAACGCGLGSLMLAERGNATSVLAADIDSDSIRYGQFRYPHPRITRKVMDILQLEAVSLFDVAVSFETIEHLEQPDQFLARVYQALKPGGIFLVSTPIASITTHTPYNPHHKIEWSYRDFHEFLQKKFEITGIFVQSLEFRTNKLVSLAKRILRIKSVSTVNPEVVKGDPTINRIFRGYQLVVCKKV